MKKTKFPGIGQVSFAVARVTFFEIIRDKLLYNIVVVSILLFALGILASRLAVIRPERVILDFGLSAIRMSGDLVAVLVGSILLIKEFDRRTVHLALCHPITRTQFVMGKFLGLSGVLALNWLLASFAYSVLLYLFKSPDSTLFSSTLFWGVLFCFLESLFLASFAIFFSTFSTASLTIIFCMGIALIGNNISQLRTLGSKAKTAFHRVLFEAMASVLPNLEYFNFGTKLTYGIAVPAKFILFSMFYCFLSIGLLLGISGVLIRYKEV